MKTGVRIAIVLCLLLPAHAFADSILRIHRQEPAAATRVRRPLIAVPNTAPWANWRLCNDANEDIEPAIIRARRSNPQGNPIDTTMTAYMKRFALGKYRLHALFYDGDTYVPPPGPLPLPAPYTTSADPIVSANPDADGTNPRTYYVIGTAQAYTETGGALSNSIMLWYLRDGEITWQRVTLATNTDPSYFADKPWVTVSRYPPDKGWIWAAYVKVSINGSAPDTIYLFRSIDGTNFGQMPATITGFGLHSPTVLVDSNTGVVYLLWISYPDNKIHLAYTTNGGVSWTFPANGVFDAGSSNEPLLGPAIDRICDSSDVCVLARTLLHARYNPVDRSIGVVWHRREPVGVQFINKTKTDVFFNSYSTLTQQWRGIHKVNAASSVNDQWNGALDYDHFSGEYVVSWYDRRDDPNNRQYAVYATRLSATGDRVDWFDSQISPGRPGYNYDPTVYQPYNNTILLGEYHDLFSWYDAANSRMIWLSADVAITWPWTQGDIWEDQIQP